MHQPISAITSSSEHSKVKSAQNHCPVSDSGWLCISDQGVSVRMVRGSNPGVIFAPVFRLETRERIGMCKVQCISIIQWVSKCLQSDHHDHEGAQIQEPCMHKNTTCKCKNNSKNRFQISLLQACMLSLKKATGNPKNSHINDSFWRVCGFQSSLLQEEGRAILVKILLFRE